MTCDLQNIIIIIIQWYIIVPTNDVHDPRQSKKIGVTTCRKKNMNYIWL